jgi:hypothetical protein
MRVKVKKIGESFHPSEAVVEVKTATGKERLVVDKRSILNESLAIGSPIAKDKALWLIELPRETMSGLWRVWVADKAVVEDTGKAAHAT